MEFPSRKTSLIYNVIEVYIVVAIHEIIHGLGFYTSLISFEDEYGMLPRFLGPRIVKDVNGLTCVDSMAIFDDLIQDFGNLISVLSSFPCKKQSGYDYIRSMQNNATIVEAGKKLYMRSTYSTLRVMTADNFLYFLNSPNVFKSGTSIVHSSSGSRKSNPDFMMAPETGQGISVDLMMRDFGWTSVLGQGVRGMLEMMGYSTRGKEQEVDLIINNFP